MNTASNSIAAMIMVITGVLLTMPGEVEAKNDWLKGTVQTGGTKHSKPKSKVRVTLYEATEGSPIVVGQTTSKKNGNFKLKARKNQTDSIFFVTANVGYGDEYVAILGPKLPPEVTINELTTVAAAYSMAQFYRTGEISGNAFSLQIAAMMAENIASARSGRTSEVLQKSPNADQTNSLRTVRSLSNLLVATTDNYLIRSTLMYLTETDSGERPRNTVVALANLARDPSWNSSYIYWLTKVKRVYTPVLHQEPDAWVVTVKVNDSGDDAFLFGGPANVAFDSRGYVWVANNVVQGTPNSARNIMVLKPNGKPADGGPGLPTSPISGGGILGVGWGITVTPDDHVWVGNFGWGDLKPTESPTDDDANGSTSLISPAGVPLSVPIGFFGGTLRVQAIKLDADGNVWSASFDNDKVVMYPGGDPTNPREVDFAANSAPFGIAVAPDGAVWVTNSGGLSGQHQSSVAKIILNNNGDPVVEFSHDVGETLKVIAVDSMGNAWFASQKNHTVYAYAPDGTQIGAYTGGGIYGPWGIAIDGEDNIWVSNFGPLELDNVLTQGRLSKLAGANPATRPLNTSIGTPISPPTGYTVQSAGEEVLLHDGTPLNGPDSNLPSYVPMMRQTSVQIDQAGNVWTVNNWKPKIATDVLGFDSGTIDEDGNPGGDGLIIFVGLAPPPK
ncbi:Virginiamycin B lyase [Thalassoglobus neptunius]|uniref:Virginiamycin B lyase n=1 Tax=Thalassoglobus neptunius TaxID=1938619 RepID=A0A5C5WIY1_9PLAN|nr:hypothetical protein [Thalassoglobus neptunius]TWT49971.1 Virginiamycin B lyase [Thalassoglobus neptunius]